MKKVFFGGLALMTALITLFYLTDKTNDTHISSTSASPSSTKSHPKSPGATEPPTAMIKTEPKERQQNYSAPTLIQNAMNQSESEQNTALERVKQWLPELAPKITQYQIDTQIQAQRVVDYQKLVAERNQLITSGDVPPDMLDALSMQKEALLEQAKILGRQGQEINRAIREQGEAYMASR